MKEDIFHYRTGIVKAIADDYVEYVPNDEMPNCWDLLIESKCDFDNAYSTLNKREKNLVFQTYCTDSWKINMRQKIFSKMARYLNGEQ